MVKDIKHDFTPEVITLLEKYEDRLRRSIMGEKISLSSVANEELSRAHKLIYGYKQSMAGCCGGSRNASVRVMPLALAYFRHINGKDDDYTGLRDSIAKKLKDQPVDESLNDVDSVEAINKPGKSKKTKSKIKQ